MRMFVKCATFFVCLVTGANALDSNGSSELRPAPLMSIPKPLARANKNHDWPQHAGDTSSPGGGLGSPATPVGLPFDFLGEGDAGGMSGDARQ